MLILFNSLIELRKSDHFFCNTFNKLNNTVARILDSINHNKILLLCTQRFYSRYLIHVVITPRPDVM